MYLSVQKRQAATNKQQGREKRKEKKRKGKERKNSQVSCSCKIIKNTENHTHTQRHTQMQNELIKSCE